MKGRILAIVAGVAGIVCFSAIKARALDEISADFQISATADFYEPLADSGEWVEVADYGRCWRPARVEADWRPYSYGHWEYTDCGWLWISDEPWGWACYHYGRWYYDPAYYWVWVPGIYWAPAWVSWRFGGGYCGWAPLPPRAGFGVSVSIGFEPPPSAFIFVPVGRIHERLTPRTVIVNNTTIINRTKNVTKITQVNKNITNIGTRRVIVNEGPPLNEVQRATRRRIEPVPVTRVVDRALPPAPIREKIRQREQQRHARERQQQQRDNFERQHQQDEQQRDLTRRRQEIERQQRERDEQFKPRRPVEPPPEQQQREQIQRERWEQERPERDVERPAQRPVERPAQRVEPRPAERPKEQPQKENRGEHRDRDGEEEQHGERGQ